MISAQTVPVLETKLVGLEKDHEFLEQIKAMTREVDLLEAEYEDANEIMKKAKKKLELKEVELRTFIKSGPPKPDAQKRLPFADDVDKGTQSTAEGSAPSTPSDEATGTSEADSEAEIEIPAEIDGLDISDLQKQRLVKAGCNTLADVIDLGNKNWPDYPQGFESLTGFGPKAQAKLKKLLPSTAPARQASDEEEGKVIRIKLLTFSGASVNLEPGSEYDATEAANGRAIIQLPGGEPVEFLPHEFEKVAISKA